MIQRKQSLYLLAAFVLSVACLCLPLGAFVPAGMGKGITLFNLALTGGPTGWHFTSSPLSVLLALSALLSLFTIFRYKNRRQQLKLCTLNIVVLVAWYLSYGVIIHLILPGTEPFKGMAFRVGFATCLPLVAFLCVLLARKGVKDDERLVKAADRIR